MYKKTPSLHRHTTTDCSAQITLQQNLSLFISSLNMPSSHSILNDITQMYAPVSVNS